MGAINANVKGLAHARSQYQDYLGSHTTGARMQETYLTASHSQRPGLRLSGNHDVDIRVKGKGSIRTLIRLANTRALSEEDEAT